MEKIGQIFQTVERAGEFDSLTDFKVILSPHPVALTGVATLRNSFLLSANQPLKD